MSVRPPWQAEPAESAPAPGDPGRYAPGPAGDDGPPRTLGEGAYGRVLLVWDRQLQREVALKVLAPRAGPPPEEASETAGIRSETAAWHTPLTLHPGLVDRFLREARVTGRLEHPSIVPVHEMGRLEDGTFYYTMKAVRGGTLAEALADGSPPRLELLDAFVDLCQAVAYAHSRGVIHRDLKPSNVMVGEFGETVLLDWGVARDLGLSEGAGPEDGSEDAAATRMGSLIGTPAYMSPEAASGRVDAIDARSDIWALGVILHELLTGSPPCRGGSPEDILEQVRSGALRVDPEGRAPPPLRSVVRRAMQPLPADRYPDARALAEEVRAWSSGGLVRAHAYSPWERLGRGVAAHGGKIAALLAVLVVMLGLIAMSARLVGEQRDRALRAEAEAGERLSASLTAQAREAVADHASAAGLVHAADALVVAETPAARGALVAADSGMLRELLWRADAPGVRELTWSAAAGLVALADGALLRWEGDGRPLPSLGGVPPRGPHDVLAASPDGARLALAIGATVRIFALGDGLDGPWRQLGPHGDSVLDLAWIDRSRLAAPTGFGVTTLWDVDLGRVIADEAGHHDHVRAVAARPGTDQLFTGANDHTLRSWRAGDLSAGPPLEDAGVGAFDLAVSPDGRLLAAGGEVRGGDGRVRIWDLRTGRLLFALPGHRAEVVRVGFSPDGRWLGSSALDGSVRLWAVPTFAPAAELRPVEARGVPFAFSPDGARLAVAVRGAEVQVWRIDTVGPSPLWSSRAGGAVAWSPSGGRLAVAGEDGQLQIVSPGQAPRTVGMPGVAAPVTALAWLDADRILVHRRAGDTQVQAVSGGGTTISWTVADGVWGENCAASPDGRWLLTVDAAFLPAIRPLDGAGPIVRPECPPIEGWGAWMPDGETVWSVARDGALVRLSTGGAPCAVVSPAGLTGGRHGRLRISPSGDRLALTRDGVVMIVDPASGAELLRLGHPGWVTSALRFSPDGGWLFASDWGGQVSAWDTADGRLLAAWKAHDNRIWDMDLSPDGRFLATTSADHSARVWVLDALDEPAVAARDRVSRLTGRVNGGAAPAR